MENLARYPLTALDLLYLLYSRAPLARYALYRWSSRAKRGICFFAAMKKPWNPLLLHCPARIRTIRFYGTHSH